ncbi:hypothetical protein EM595_2622 [Duffyella gerundensis]|uniref:Uncharacterized protein n=1 Tax=Duffyella gerundensis TaxID=1619313 RepID=A0A0U5L715_9GAMM|nr:hypothetical protein EM595_2622 [Duffyella gerundensis]
MHQAFTYENAFSLIVAMVQVDESPAKALSVGSIQLVLEPASGKNHTFKLSRERRKCA